MTRNLVTLRQAEEARPWATERFLRRLVAERRIPYHKLGGKLLLDLDELDALAERGRVEPPAAVRVPASKRNTGASRPRVA